VLARLPRLLIVLALASSIGLHWAFLQAVAWSGMIVTYVQDGSIAEAVSKTFDGRHPCKLCKKIEKGQQAEKKAEFKYEFGKLEFSCPATCLSVWLPSRPRESLSLGATLHGLSHAPPSPPPRSVPT
jgi:hypothetical protein